MKLCRKVSKKIIIIVANFTSLRALVNRIDWIVVICKTRNAQNSIELNSKCIARQTISTKPNIDNENMTKILKLFNFVGLVRYFMKRSSNKRFSPFDIQNNNVSKRNRFYRYIYQCGLTI